MAEYKYWTLTTSEKLMKKAFCFIIALSFHFHTSFLTEQYIKRKIFDSLKIEFINHEPYNSFCTPSWIFYIMWAFSRQSSNYRKNIFFHSLFVEICIVEPNIYQAANEMEKNVSNVYTGKVTLIFTVWDQRSWVAHVWNLGCWRISDSQQFCGWGGGCCFIWKKEK